MDYIFIPRTVDTDATWTIRNQEAVEVYRICRYHASKYGDTCRYGDQCRFIHYSELEQANKLDVQQQQLALQNQTLVVLLQIQLVCASILRVLHPNTDSLSQDAADPEQHTHMRCAPLASSASTLSPHAPAWTGTVHFPNAPSTTAPRPTATKKVHAAVDPEVIEESKYNDAIDDVVVEHILFKTDIDTAELQQTIEVKSDDIPSDAKHDSERFIVADDCDFFGVTPKDAKHCKEQLSCQQIDLFKFLWANSKHHLLQVLPPQVLPATYPEQCLCAHAMSGLPYENGSLCNLRTKKFNELPVRILTYDADRDRYAIEIMVLSDDADRVRQFYVKLENIKFL